MCGIAGIYNKTSIRPVAEETIRNMVDIMQYRGPDESGIFCSDTIGLGHARLSIIDLSGGHQPMHNEDGSLQVVFNGEIFNYIELRQDLITKGHRFKTGSDTEVLVHLYEEHGIHFVDHLIGQFAIALWDTNKKKLVLARDRVGIRPLYYCHTQQGDLLFASEIKSIFASNLIVPEFDPVGIHQVLTFWVPIPPRTVYKGICELPPGHVYEVSPSGEQLHHYWKPEFPDWHDYDVRPLSYYTERVREILYDAVQLRLRADVPVAAYLSGGLDSSIITGMVQKYFDNRLLTFSLEFSDGEYDESSYQKEMASLLNVGHRSIRVGYNDIAGVFEDVIWHAEVPILRSAPAPLYLLSKLVRENNTKVVLTGEGADEVFGGYNIFRESMIRRFWAKNPESKKRPKLLSTLYPFMRRDNRTAAFWQLFFKKGLSDVDNPFYSHTVRWGNTSRIKDLLTREFSFMVKDADVYDEMKAYISPDIMKWHPLCRAQYLEMTLFMSGYLLSSQGDRMMMANSVEGRFPFLDHRLIEFAATIPPVYKVQGLNEKYILKETFRDIVPDSIIYRDKQPYRSPVQKSLMQLKKPLEGVRAIQHHGVPFFDGPRVDALFNKMERTPEGLAANSNDMSLAAMVSLSILYDKFIKKK